MPYHTYPLGAGLGWLLGLLLLVGLILLIAWAVSAFRDGGRREERTVPRDSSRPSPNEILRERFARGEITEEQFEQMRKVLGPDR